MTIKKRLISRNILICSSICCNDTQDIVKELITNRDLNTRLYSPFDCCHLLGLDPRPQCRKWLAVTENTVFFLSIIYISYSNKYHNQNAIDLLIYIKTFSYNLIFPSVQISRFQFSFTSHNRFVGDANRIIRN